MLKKMTQSDKNYANLRSHIKQCLPPVVPFIGLYLKDLTFLEDGNNTFLQNGLINMDKCYMITNIIQSIQQYQKIGFDLEYAELPVFQEWLSNIELVDQNYIYERSLEVEPRNFSFQHYEKLLLEYDKLTDVVLPKPLVSVIPRYHFRTFLILFVSQKSLPLEKATKNPKQQT